MFTCLPLRGLLLLQALYFVHARTSEGRLCLISPQTNTVSLGQWVMAARCPRASVQIGKMTNGKSTLCKEGCTYTHTHPIGQSLHFDSGTYLRSRRESGA